MWLINEALSREGVWGCGSIAPTFLTSALHGGELSTSLPGLITPREKNPCYSVDRKLSGTRAKLDAAGKRNISYHCRESNPCRQVRSPSLYWLSYPGSKINRYKFIRSHNYTYALTWIGTLGVKKRTKERNLGRQERGVRGDRALIQKQDVVVA
jgi:hypothetical protein